MKTKNTKDTKYASDWLSLGGIVLGIGIAVFSVLQPWVAMGLGILAAFCFFFAWLLSRKEHERDARVTEQRIREIDQNAKQRIQKVMQDTDLLVQQAQDNAELRIQDIEERFDEYENDSSMMDERYNDEL